jgi:hypothetical protein
MTYDEGEGKLVYFAHAAANEPQTWVMDPGKGQWSRIELATQPPGRFGGAMAYDPVRKRSLLFGGGPYPKPGRDLWAYDARTSVWTRLVDAPFEVKNAGFAYDSRHDIFMASAQGGGVPNRTLVYSPAANAWSEVLPAPGDSWPEWSGTSQAMAFDPANDVFVFLREGLGVPRWFVFRYAR